MDNLDTIVFYFLAALALVGAMGILVSRNIVRTAMWLLATLVAAAGLYFLLGAAFVGAIQLIVYAGGTLVLIIFGVMLTAKNPNVSYTPRTAEIVLGVVLCVLLAGALIFVLHGTAWPNNVKSVEEVKRMSQAQRDLVGPNNPDATESTGRRFLGDYLVPFEVLSLVLLAVLIGAAYLGRPKVPVIGAPRGVNPPPGQEGPRK
ncbi:MAG: NADH-quinone oxidoreductase subunit J [Planctomycetota bacterium]|nr:NADH-quinone oxidoreductase subunit J [Planctomycetota bacterium]